MGAAFSSRVVDDDGCCSSKVTAGDGGAMVTAAAGGGGGDDGGDGGGNMERNNFETHTVSGVGYSTSFLLLKAERYVLNDLYLASSLIPTNPARSFLLMRGIPLSRSAWRIRMGLLPNFNVVLT